MWLLVMTCVVKFRIMPISWWNRGSNKQCLLRLWLVQELVQGFNKSQYKDQNNGLWQYYRYFCLPGEAIIVEQGQQGSLGAEQGLEQWLKQWIKVLLILLNTWRGNHGGIEQLQHGESIQYRGFKTHLCASRGWIWQEGIRGVVKEKSKGRNREC